MISEKIKMLCEKNGTTVFRLEKDCGFSKSCIIKWDSASTTIAKLTIVADYFNVSLDYLAGRTGEYINPEN